MDAFRYYQYKSENPRPSEAIIAYEDTSLVPLKDYQRKRILTFLAPEVEDPTELEQTGTEYKLLLLCHWWNHRQGFRKWNAGKAWVPPSAVAHNDFIFAVLAEESGLLGGFIAVFAFGLIIFGCLKVASKAADPFGAMIAVGVSVLLMTHMFVNVGMTIGITPITGLPLPFLSYGGSFVVTCFMMLGVVQSVYRFRKQFR